MAHKLSDLTELPSGQVASDDELYIRDVSEPAVTESKRVTTDAVRTFVGGGGGFILGPTQNTFTGATRTAAESARNTYAAANATWLAQYNAHGYDQTANVIYYCVLSYGTTTTAIVRNAGAWFDITSLVTGGQGGPGPRGLPGMAGTLLATGIPTESASGPINSGNIGMFKVPLDAGGDPDEALIRTIVSNPSGPDDAVYGRYGFHAGELSALWQIVWASSRWILWAPEAGGDITDLGAWRYVVDTFVRANTTNYFNSLTFTTWVPAAPIQVNSELNHPFSDVLKFWVSTDPWPNDNNFDATPPVGTEDRYIRYALGLVPLRRYAAFKDTATFEASDFTDAAATRSRSQIIQFPREADPLTRRYLGIAYPATETAAYVIIRGGGINYFGDFAEQAAEVTLAGTQYKVLVTTDVVPTAIITGLFGLVE